MSTTANTTPSNGVFFNNSGSKLTITGRLHQQLFAGEPISAMTVDEIDEIIVDLQAAQDWFNAAKEVLDNHKSAIIALIRTHGAVPPGAEQSKRILGRRNQATIITGTTTVVFEAAVYDLIDFLAREERMDLFDKLFVQETKHKLIDSARNVLAAVDLPRTKHEKVLSLFGRCFDIKPKSPSLKFDIITPEKPAKKARGGKVAA